MTETGPQTHTSWATAQILISNTASLPGRVLTRVSPQKATSFFGCHDKPAVDPIWVVSPAFGDTDDSWQLVEAEYAPAAYFTPEVALFGATISRAKAHPRRSRRV